MNCAPQRPLLRYHGGKWRLAPWIVSHFPKHRTYVEPFGGGASVLLRKARSYAEVYNELDGEIVNVFRVTRDQGEQLQRALELTPFAREEFDLSYQPTDDPIEQARRTIVRSFQGFGSASITGEVSGFRSNSNRSYTTPAHDWRNYPDKLVALIERMRGVVIENRDAVRCMQHHDSDDTLHYVDPLCPFDPQQQAAEHRFRQELPARTDRPAARRPVHRPVRAARARRRFRLPLRPVRPPFRHVAAHRQDRPGRWRTAAR